MSNCSVCGGPLTPATVREGCDYHAMPDECIEILKARIAKLEAALRPFAELYDEHDDNFERCVLVLRTELRAAAAAREEK